MEILVIAVLLVLSIVALVKDNPGMFIIVVAIGAFFMAITIDNKPNIKINDEFIVMAQNKCTTFGGIADLDRNRVICNDGSEIKFNHKPKAEKEG